MLMGLQMLFSSFLAYSHFLNIKEGIILTRKFSLKQEKNYNLRTEGFLQLQVNFILHISICHKNYRANGITRPSPSQPRDEGKGRGKERNKEGPGGSCWSTTLRAPSLVPLMYSQNQASLSCADSRSEYQHIQRPREVVYHFIQSSPHFEVEFEE